MGNVLQRRADANVAAVSQTQTALTDSTTGAASTTLAAVTNPTLSDWNGSSVYPSAAQGTAINAAITSLKNAVASLAAELALVKADNANIIARINGTG